MNLLDIYYVPFMAIDTDKYIDIYKQYHEYFSNFSIINDILRSLGWLIVKGMLGITSMARTLLDKVFDFINFLGSDNVVQFFNTVKPFVWTVFFFALIYLAYCYMIAHEKPKGVAANLLIFAGTTIVLPYLMAQMNQIVMYGKDILSSDMEAGSYELLSPYITDLVYLDSIDFNETKIADGKYNGFTDKNYDNIQYIDINEVVDPGDYELVNEKLFKKQLVSKVKGDKEDLYVENIREFKIYFSGQVPYYYRYHVNFVIVSLYLAALILVLGFSSVKVVHLIYELAAEKVMAPFIAAGDLTSGQKIRKALIGILNGYITLLCVLFLQRLFILSTEWINAKTWSDSAAANGVTKAVLIAAGALFVIDGPNFFEQIFGVDAGLKSVGQALQSAYYASQMMGGVKRSIAGGVSKIAGAGKSAAGAVAGGIGYMMGRKDTGTFPSNNEKVSQDMSAGVFMPPDFNSQPAIGMENGEDMDASAMLPGGGEPRLPGGDNGSAAFGKGGQKSAGGQDSSIPGGDGKQNLSGTATSGAEADKNAAVNDAINDALNNTSGQGDQTPDNMAGGGIHDKDNLINWAMRNTRAGQHLTSSFEKGRSLGRATGNTINERNRKKEGRNQTKSQTNGNRPERPSRMNKDNL